MVWGLPCNSMRFTYSNSSSIQGQPVLVIPFFQGGLTMCQPGPANILHYFNRFAWLGSFLIMFLQKMCPFTGKIIAQIDRNTSDLVEMWYWIHFIVFFWKKEVLWMGDLKLRFKTASKIQKQAKFLMHFQCLVLFKWLKAWLFPYLLSMKWLNLSNFFCFLLLRTPINDVWFNGWSEMN